MAQGLVFGFALVRYRYHKMYRIYTDVSVTAKSGSTTFRRRVNEKCVGRRRQRGMDAKGSCGGGGGPSGGASSSTEQKPCRHEMKRVPFLEVSWGSRGGLKSALLYPLQHIYLSLTPASPVFWPRTKVVIAATVRH